jgi:hypothetical protein
VLRQASLIQCVCRCTQQISDFALGKLCCAHFLNAVHDQRNYSTKPIDVLSLITPILPRAG